LEEHDVIVVGARCAGSSLANLLARRGWDVLLLDKDVFPSTTISTHVLWPSGVARLEHLGVLDRLNARHELPGFDFRIRGLGHEIVGGFTPVGGLGRGVAPRRIALDQAGVDAARAAGAIAELDTRVVGLLGRGSTEDPVRGVVLADGRRIGARWVLGADGRSSIFARSLGLRNERPMRGELSAAYAYWRDLPDDGYCTFHIEPDRVLTSAPVEDGLHMLIAWGGPSIARGTKTERRASYARFVRAFPETVSRQSLADADLVSDVTVAPESLMRGFFRRASGPGWALLGDACQFKHPSTAQGIGDALEHAFHVADTISTSPSSLDAYQQWRDAFAAEYYEWSFTWGRFPRPGIDEPIFRGWASESDAAQDLRDAFQRLVKPSAVLTKERLSRWLGPPTNG
jgi:2-polyprenyl-6-methoxyphenol hydroxylase-like FAD-dependent oxidoreductase